jgi:hypothetical protein
MTAEAASSIFQKALEAMTAKAESFAPNTTVEHTAKTAYERGMVTTDYNEAMALATWLSSIGSSGTAALIRTRAKSFAPAISARLIPKAGTFSQTAQGLDPQAAFTAGFSQLMGAQVAGAQSTAVVPVASADAAPAIPMPPPAQVHPAMMPGFGANPIMPPMTLDAAKGFAAQATTADEAKTAADFLALRGHPTIAAELKAKYGI